MEEAEINEDDLTMDFESGIDTWVIEKDESTSKLNVDNSLTVLDSETMNKENVNTKAKKAHYITVSKKNTQDCSPACENLKRKSLAKNDEGHFLKKQKIEFDPLDVALINEGVFKPKLSRATSTSSFASLEKKDILSSEEISLLLSEDSSESNSEKNRERLHSIENVSDLLEKIKGKDTLQLVDDLMSISKRLRRKSTSSISEQNLTSDYLKPPVSINKNIDPLSNNHLLRHNSVVSNNDVKDSFEIKNMKKVLNGHAVSNETMNCNICNYYSSDCLVYETHMILFHSESKELYCEDCSYHTCDVAKLAKHIRKHYEFVDCPYCSFKGLMRKGMEGHLKKVHPNMKAFKCDCCTFSCKTKQQFQEHVELHSDQFQCGDCNLYFANKHIMKKHVLNHLKSNRDPYKCGKCDLTFPDKLHMKVHNKKFHSTKFTCNTCNSKFTQKSLLKVHMKIHSGVDTHKIIKCKQCGLVFARKNHLTNHLRFNHLPEFYKCRYCSFECNESSVFSKHTCVNKICNVQKSYSNLNEINVDSNSENGTSHENLVQEVMFDESVSNNNNKKRALKRPYTKKVYKTSRQKVSSLRNNLPSRRSQATLDNQHISSHSTQLKNPVKKNFKMTFNNIKRLDKMKKTINGTYKPHSNKNVLPVIGSKILKGGRGQPRKLVTLKKLSVPFNCKEILFGKALSPKKLFVEPLRITNENYIECFYQSHNPSSVHSHIERHVRPSTLLSCRLCRYKTNSGQLLQRHMAKIHSWDPAIVNILFS